MTSITANIPTLGGTYEVSFEYLWWQLADRSTFAAFITDGQGSDDHGLPLQRGGSDNRCPTNLGRRPLCLRPQSGVLISFEKGTIQWLNPLHGPRASRRG